MVKKVSSILFPEALAVSYGDTNIPALTDPNGGWGDPRDHRLCLSMLNGSV